MLFYRKGRDSTRLIVFFAGWGCDEHQFEYLHDDCDVLIVYDYSAEPFGFAFSAYKTVDVIGYSAGVFMSAVLRDRIPAVRRAVAVNGNPFLFDERFGLSAQKVRSMREITLDNYMDFRRAYICMPDELERYGKMTFSRAFDSYARELDFLEDLYEREKNTLRPTFDKAIFADGEGLFDLAAQREFFGDKLKILPDSKHHVFFKFSSFADIVDF